MTQVPEPYPALDWSAQRTEGFAGSVMALWLEYLERLRDLPIDRGLRERDVREAVAIEVPDDPMGDDDLLDYIRAVMFDQSMYPGHPGFMAYVSGSGTVPGAAADLLAAALNQNLGGWRLAPAATEIELSLTRWLAGCFGYPEGAGGLVQSGGAMANFVCLKAARDAKAGYQVREKGIRDLPPMTFYASEEAHVVISRAADMMGLGTEAVRAVAVDENYRMRVDVLEDLIARDREDGFLPAVVVGTAGTTATGAVDPLLELARVSQANDMWFHVDGAYGGPAILSEKLKPLLAGIELSDSVVMDPHKWLYTPHSGGCALVRDFSTLGKSFGAGAAYVYEDKDLTGRGVDLGQIGPQFSRGFHAFKVWISLLAHGRRAYADRIAHDVDLTHYLARKVEEHPELELMAPVTLSICCFRYVPPDVPETVDRDAYLDKLNERLMPAVQIDGRVYFSNAVLNGRFTQRTCVVNFRTEAEDMDAVVDSTVRIGRELHEKMKAEL